MVLATRPRALSIELRRDPFIYLVPDADRGEIPTTSQLRYTWALVMFQMSWVVSRWKALGDLSEGLLPTALRLVG